MVRQSPTLPQLVAASPVWATHTRGLPPPLCAAFGIASCWGRAADSRAVHGHWRQHHNHHNPGVSRPPLRPRVPPAPPWGRPSHSLPRGPPVQAVTGLPSRLRAARPVPAGATTQATSPGTDPLRASHCGGHVVRSSEKKQPGAVRSVMEPPIPRCPHPAPPPPPHPPAPHTTDDIDPPSGTSPSTAATRARPAWLHECMPRTPCPAPPRPVPPRPAHHTLPHFHLHAPCLRAPHVHVPPPPCPAPPRPSTPTPRTSTPLHPHAPPPVNLHVAPHLSGHRPP